MEAILQKGLWQKIIIYANDAILVLKCFYVYLFQSLIFYSPQFFHRNLISILNFAEILGSMLQIDSILYRCPPNLKFKNRSFSIIQNINLAVRNKIGKIWFTHLLLNIDSWNFLWRFLIQMSIRYIIYLIRLSVGHATNYINNYMVRFSDFIYFYHHNFNNSSLIFMFTEKLFCTFYRLLD